VAAMLAYDGSIGDGKVTRITVFGPQAAQDAA
jgi:hypothetical protein